MKFMRKNGGFTLVELIVVIAILAILAGVAVPAYSGYIKKANEAADNQLLGAVNTAYAAACIELNVDKADQPNANIVLQGAAGEKTVESVRVPGYAKFNDSFMTYYAGNTESKFKVFVLLSYDPASGSFKGYTDGEVVGVNYGGNIIYVSPEAADKLVNSTFGITIGADKLLGQVADVSALAEQSILSGSDSVLSTIVGSPEYFGNLANSLNMTEQELNDHLLAQGENANKFMANSLVLSTAQNTAGMTTEDVTNKLTSDSFLTDMSTKLNNKETAQEGLADAALAYGMYTSYMYANGKEDQIGNINDFASLKSALDVMKTDDFKNYLNNEGQADVDAYLSAMEVIDSTTASPDALNSALTNGFDDPALAEVLQSLGMKK